MFSRWLLTVFTIAPCYSFYIVKIDIGGLSCYVDADGDRSRCYLSPSVTADWETARRHCHSYQGHLAYTRDELALELVKRAMQSEGWVAIWLGGKKRDTYWKWYGDSQTGIGNFSAWDSGTPTHGVPDLECVMIIPSQNFVWQDRPCAFKVGYICETVETNPLCAAALQTYQEVLTSEGRCFMFARDQVNWFMARQICHQKGARLAKVDDASIHHRIGQALPGKDTDIYGFWIGLTRVQWTWLDGQEVRTTFWESGQPGHKGDCLRLEKFGDELFQWSDADCYSKHNFICELEIDPNLVPTRSSETTRPASSGSTATSSRSTTTPTTTTPASTTSPTIATTNPSTTTSSPTTSTTTPTTTATTATTTPTPRPSSTLKQTTKPPPTTETTEVRTTSKSTTTTKTSTSRPVTPKESVLSSSPNPINTTQTPFTREPLQKICIGIDMAFLLDSSLYVEEWEWLAMRSYVKRVLEKYVHSQECLSATMISFGTASMVARIPSSGGEEAATDVIDRLVIQNGQRNIDGALLTMINDVFSRQSDGSSTPHMGVVITKGPQTVEQEETERDIAHRAKLMGIVLSSIVIGNDSLPKYAGDIASDPSSLFATQVVNIARLDIKVVHLQDLMEGVAYGQISTLRPTTITPSVPLVINKTDTDIKQTSADKSEDTLMIATTVTVVSLVVVTGLIILLVVFFVRRKRKADERAIIARGSPVRHSRRSVKSSGSISPNSSISTPWGTKRNSLRGIAPQSFGRTRSQPRAGLTNPEANNLFYNSWIIPSDKRT